MEWDTYKTDSIEATLRVKRDNGEPSLVLPDTSIPDSWKSFMRVDSNKDALFKFLAGVIEGMDISPDKSIETTYGWDFLSISSDLDKSDICPCTHEEADYRMCLHARYAYNMGYWNVLI